MPNELRKVLEELVMDIQGGDLNMFSVEKIDDAIASIHSLLLNGAPEDRATTHEYCDAYLNHVDRKGNPLAVNHCQHEIDEDNKKIGFNESNSLWREHINKITGAR
jgi:hypothetical protein